LAVELVYQVEKSCVISFDELGLFHNKKLSQACFPHVPFIDLKPFRTVISPGLKPGPAQLGRCVC